jgi:hypothetical protein
MRIAACVSALGLNRVRRGMRRRFIEAASAGSWNLRDDAVQDRKESER